MDNQHKKITGYRDLSQDEIDTMNTIKSMAVAVGDIISAMEDSDVVDLRWVAIAKTQLQQGFMAAVRAVAKPTSF